MNSYKLEKDILVSYKVGDEIKEEIIKKDLCIEVLEEKSETKEEDKILTLEKTISFINEKNKERVILEKGDKIRVSEKIEEEKLEEEEKSEEKVKESTEKKDKTSLKEEYQGWTNWETWNMSLWADNDYDMYQDRVKTQKKIKRWDKRSVERFLMNQFPDGTPDMEGNDIKKVNWQEIADSWNDEIFEKKEIEREDKKEKLEEGLLIKGINNNGIETTKVYDSGVFTGVELKIDNSSTILDKKAVKSLASNLNMILR